MTPAIIRPGIDWKSHLTAREGRENRERLRTAISSREDEPFVHNATWFPGTRTANRRKLPGGGVMLVNLIGDYLPGEEQ
jgi:hypothetical protein